jgi:hypothetical protein
MAGKRVQACDADRAPMLPPDPGSSVCNGIQGLANPNCSAALPAIDISLKPNTKFQMSEFKRNQVEEAISRMLEPRSPEPTSDLRTRLKRLLDTDRAFGRDRRYNDPKLARYAFYSDEAPGSGTEVWFSEYECFALLNGLRLLGHGWPQGFAVLVLRQVRPELEDQHARIRKQDPKSLFDPAEIVRNARPGAMAFDNTDPVLLTIVSKPSGAPSKEGGPIACAVCQGEAAAVNFAREHGAGAWTMFELATVAHQLSKALADTEPRRRGRG